MKSLKDLTSFLITLFYHRKIIASLEEECAKPFETRVHEIKSRFGDVEFRLENRLMLLFFEALVEIFENEEKAINFFSMRFVCHSDEYEIIVKPVSGKMPATMLAEAKDELLALEVMQSQSSKEIASLKTSRQNILDELNEFKKTAKVFFDNYNDSAAQDEAQDKLEELIER